jgi:hypothetical protein
MGCNWSVCHQLTVRLGTFMLHINMSGSDDTVVGFGSSVTGTCLLFVAKALVLHSVISL